MVDLCCGEGRLSRALTTAGHEVVGLDASAALVAAARAAAPDIPVVHADAAAAPLASGCADVVVAFMCLHDLDDPEQAFREARRITRGGGRLVVALLDPRISAGLTGGVHDATYEKTVRRRGLEQTYRGAHRSLAWYLDRAREVGFELLVRDDAVGPDGSRNFVDLVLVASAPARG